MLTATQVRPLINDVCRRFTQATGWALRFTADVDQGDLTRRMRADPNCCWMAEVRGGKRCVGMLSLSPPRPGSRHSTFLQVTELADALTALLSKLFTAVQGNESQNEAVSTLVELGIAAPAQDNLPWLMTHLLSAVVQLTASRSAVFFLLDRTLARLKLRAVFRVEADEVPHPVRDLELSGPDLKALLDRVATFGPSDLAFTPESEDTLGSTRAAVAWPAETSWGSWCPVGCQSGLIVAVESQTMPIGTLWLFDQGSRAYSERDIHVAQSIAAQLAAGLERSALLQTSENSLRISKALKIASESQVLVSPENLPVDPRFEIAAQCSSRYELGGDLFEIFPITKDRWAIAVGDATGNSIPAALIMSTVRGGIQTHPADQHEVSRLMERLNQALYKITRTHQFMSLCYGVFDAAHLRFTYTNAGHPTPILIRHGMIHTMRSHGLLLGINPDVNYPGDTIELIPGDVLIFYSDGISEARGTNDELYGEARIARFAIDHIRHPAEELLKGILEDVDSHSGELGAADDRTLAIVKIF